MFINAQKDCKQDLRGLLMSFKIENSYTLDHGTSYFRWFVDFESMEMKCPDMQTHYRIKLENGQWYFTLLNQESWFEIKWSQTLDSAYQEYMEPKWCWAKSNEL
jgi:hypothetical protein